MKRRKKMEKTMNNMTTANDRREELGALVQALRVLNGDCHDMDSPEFALTYTSSEDHARVVTALQRVYGDGGVPKYFCVPDEDDPAGDECHTKNYSVIGDAVYEVEQRLEPLLFAEARAIAEMAITRKEEEGKVLSESKRDFIIDVKLELESLYSAQQNLGTREDDVEAFLKKMGWLFEDKEETEDEY